ncbi:hypothetical protein Goshw_001119 [Gossypium schwendimanii]|uniref:Uncharacterized protein n=1 Tax=Gossypium schwendimanii TaxID=34291 RepID=A0A7J9N3L9_GOSSC|nr:hypothetical protein [Gossypium schwendimanii]
MKMDTPLFIMLHTWVLDYQLWKNC